MTNVCKCEDCEKYINEDEYMLNLGYCNNCLNNSYQKYLEGKDEIK